MKKYINPEIEITKLSTDDVISTSIGTETSIQDETDGSWQIGIGI